ncbi:MAG: hypothetical protein ACRETQ_09455 [Gammaproteobacteria bacterium]
MFRKAQRLRCPECDAWNDIPRRELAVGRTWRCPHCGAGLYLNRLRDEPGAKAQWHLESREPLDEERLQV